jgi:hypothetical protein
MDKLISEELVRQIRLMNYDRSKTTTEQFIIPPMSPIGSGLGSGLGTAIVKNMSENEKEKDYDYLYTKWAPYVCGLGGPGGISPDNSFGSFSASRCGWAYNKLSPMKICSTPIIDVEYDSPSYNAYGGKSYYAKEVNKRRKEGKKFTQNGGGVVVKKSTGTVYNTYWCECKKDVEFWALTDYNSNRPTGSYFRLDGPLSFEHATDQPQWTSINSWFDLKRCTSTNKSEEWVDKNYHTIVPIVALALQLLGGPIGIALGTALELSDSFKYQEEGNTYAAGLAFIFALVGPLDGGLGPIIKKYGDDLIRKVAVKSSKFTDEEIKLLQLLKNQKRVMSLVRLGTAVKLVRQIMVKINNFKMFSLFLLKLVNLGLVSFGYLRKFGLSVGGVFLTWDYIAYKYNVENTLPLVSLKQSDWKILQYLGTAGEYLQPFTTGVMSQTPEVKKIMEDANKAFLLDNRISNALEDSIAEGFSFSTKYNSTYMIDVTFIQYVLKALGFAKKLTSTFYAGMSPGGLFTFSKSQNISKVQLYEHKEVPLMMSPKAISNLPLSAQAGKLVKEWNPYNGKPITMFIPDAVKNKKKYFAIITDNLGRQMGLRLTSSFMEKLFNIKDNGNFDMTFHWGYYDDFTKGAVIEYQKSKGLKSDGIAGTETLKKLKEDAISYKRKNSKDIPNYNNIEMTDEEIEKVRLNTVKELEEFKSTIDEKLLIKEKDVQMAYEKEKQDIINETTTFMEGLVDKTEVTEETLKKLGDLEIKISSGSTNEKDLK